MRVPGYGATGWRSRVHAVCLALATCAIAPTWAQVELAPHIQDTMVVQRGSRWEVSGTADDEGRLKLSFLGQEVEVRPLGGKWSAFFDVPAHAVGPAELTVGGGMLRKVQVGDIWVCSGQSNMALPAARATDSESITRLLRGKTIALYQVPKPIMAQQPHAGRWMAATPERVGKFSAVCLAFGASLAERIKVPVGLIDSSLGGSWIESWISASSLGRLPAAVSAQARFDRVARAREIRGRRTNTAGLDKPSQLFDLMIRPLGMQSVKGVLWYQGEGNRQNAGSYAELLSTLISDWRSHWGNPALPFVVMQLPGYGAPSLEFDPRSAWAAVREAQRVAVAAAQSAELVVTLDLGDGTLHPPAKLPFGRRAAEAAYRLAYQEGRQDAPPVPTKLSFDGNYATVEFGHGRTCLERSPDLRKMVFVAGADRCWYPGEVSLGLSSMRVHSARVLRPIAVRYAWSDFPQPGLLTCDDGVPVGPFRTDTWPWDAPFHVIEGGMCQALQN